MTFETAMAVIRKEMDFLGMTFSEVIAFIEKSPMAQNQKTLEAYKVYKSERELL